MKKKTYQIKGKKFNNLYEAMFYFNVSPDSFNKRRRKGETIEKAFSRGRSKVGPKSKFKTKKDFSNRAKLILKNFTLKNKIKKPEDWYKFDLKTIGGLLGVYGKYPFTNFKNVIETLEWYTKKKLYPWNFQMVPMRFWNEEENVHAYVKWLRKKLRIKKLSDWYKVDRRHFVNNSGAGMLVKIEQGSLYELLKKVYPKYNWIPWLFSYSHQGIWEDKKNHRLFLEWMMKKEKININNNSIFRLNSNLVIEYHGRNIIKKYDNFVECLFANFPEIKFNRFSFFHKGRGIWEDENNHRGALLTLGEKLGFKTKNDWYGITVEDFENNGLSGLYTLPIYKGSPALVCKKNLKEHDFDMTRFNYSSKFEFRARCFAKCLFGKNNIIREPYLNYLKYKKSGRRMKLDIFIPKPNIKKKWKLGIEYNGRQHYFKSFNHTKKEFEHLKELDKEKAISCQKFKIKLIIIKYSEWDGSPNQFIDIFKKSINISKQQVKTFWERFKKDELYDGIMIELKKNLI